MRTRLTIVGIVLLAAVAAVGVVVLLVALLGVPAGLAVGVLGAAAVLVVYRLAVQPWQHRWGATDEEVAASLPGDGILPDAATTTRAIAIAAPPEAVWPWLLQLGHGRAGWYSYDWIDNDGRPSADRVVPELQDLRVGDQIPMVPGMGPRVRELEPNRHLLAGDVEGGTWCLALRPVAGGTRLASRWRVRWTPTPATVLWTLLSDPGAFVMERRMLKGIKARAERAAGGAAA
jgi:hypothetical protein